MKYLKLGVGVLLLIGILVVNNILNWSVEVVSTNEYLKCSESYLTYKNNGMYSIVEKDGTNYLVVDSISPGETIYSQQFENNGGQLFVKYYTQLEENTDYSYMFPIQSESDVPNLEFPYELGDNVLFQVSENGNPGPVEIGKLVGTTSLCKKE